MAHRPIIAHFIVGLGLGGAERSLQQLVEATHDEFDHHVLCVRAKPNPQAQVADAPSNDESKNEAPTRDASKNDVSTKDVSTKDASANRAPQPEPDDPGAFIRANGGTVHYFEVSKSNPLSWVQALLRARQQCRILAPDLIQGWMYLGNLLASVVALGYRRARLARATQAQAGVGHCPLVWNVRSAVTTLSDEKWTTRFAIRLGGWRRLQPDLILFNSHAAQEGHAQFGFDRVANQVIVNGVAVEDFVTDPRARLQWRQHFGLEHCAVIGLVGRYHPVKGVDVLLRALRPLLTAEDAQGAQDAKGAKEVKDAKEVEEAEIVSQDLKPKPCHVVLIGPGMTLDNPSLARDLAEAKVPLERVTCAGALGNIAQVMQSIDVMVVSSWREGTPNVVLEAMACGVPCVGTRVGDVPRLLRDPKRLTEPGDTQGLLACIHYALEKGTTWREDDQQFILSSYTTQQCIANYRSTYADLLA